MVRWSLRSAREVSKLVVIGSVRSPKLDACRRHRSSVLADAAVWSLIQEMELTPKPALVDARGPGAHRDMNLAMLRRSALALRETFFSIVARAFEAELSIDLREDLTALGREGEKSMLAETKGVNTHRGAIWTLGLLCAATSMLGSSAIEPEEVCMLAGLLARLPDRNAVPQLSHGLLAYQRYGARGARGEAENGFPNLVANALPMLKKSRGDGGSEIQARLNAFLSIMEKLEDTCLLYRGGPRALAVARHGARKSLDLGGAATKEGMQALLGLDASLLRMGASPGGSADLLAGALFLEAAEKEFGYTEN